jgi:membrane protein
MSPRLFLRELGGALAGNRIKDMAAQLAFWALLSIFPFFIFLLTLVGFLPLDGIEEQFLTLLYELMPGEAAALFDHTLREILGRQHGVLLLLSLLLAAWSASGGMGATAQALNLAWGVEETRPWWRRRLRFLVVTVGAALMLIVATTALIIGPNVIHTVWSWFELGGTFDRVWPWLRWPVVLFGLLTALAALYYFLPNVRRPFQIVSPGAVVAVGAWVAGSVGFRVYVAHVHTFARTYGTLGGAVILLLWLYLSSFTIILGGEINATWYRLRRTRASKRKARTG